MSWRKDVIAFRRDVTMRFHSAVVFVAFVLVVVVVDYDTHSVWVMG